MKLNGKIINLNGEQIGEVELPSQFFEEVREDLVKRAYWAVFSHSLQPYGVDPLAGKRRVVSWKKRRRKRYRTFYNWGISRAPKYILAKFGGGWMRIVFKAGFAPFAVGGRRAHPPLAQKILYEKVNKKERKKAIRSCIAATANRYYIIRRGHKIPENIFLPIIVDNKLEELKKTKDVYEFLMKLNLKEELGRVKDKKIRSGKGKMRGRRYKKKVGPLIVVSRDDAPLIKAGRNIPGIDVVPVNKLNLLLLAPGAKPGRLTIWTLNSIERLKNEKLFW